MESAEPPVMRRIPATRGALRRTAAKLALVGRRMVDVNSLVTHTFPLERGQEGFALLDGYRGDVGKVVITLG